MIPAIQHVSVTTMSIHITALMHLICKFETAFAEPLKPVWKTVSVCALLFTLIDQE